MTLAAAGLSAALAGSPDQVDAQATGFAMRLSDGTEVVMNTETIPVQVQGDILDRLQGCIGGGENSRDQCIVNAATRIARERLDAVIIETKQELRPLEEGIGLTADEIIQEPVFCEYAPDTNSAQTCENVVGNVQLAALEYQLADARQKRVSSETREGQLDQAIATKEEELAVANAVISALQRVTREN